MGPLPTEAPKHLHRGLRRVRNGGAILFNLALVIPAWGDWWSVAIVLVGLAVMMVLNFALLGRLEQRTSRDVAESVRMLSSGVIFVVYGPFVDWSVILWMLVPLNMIWLHGPGGKERTRATAYLVLTLTGAVLGGADLIMALAFAMLGIICFIIAEQRTAQFYAALREILHQQEQLQQAQKRAIAQEKLSSLGMMAAGIVHEINNPMSFVTLNVHSLHQELVQVPSLPPPLPEYVEEVLPATLDGLKRINDIIADLRRFSRGDQEAHVEYDLNAEARAALRIAQAQLNHCQVEVELGEVGPLTGRPRQIAQVLLNLLVNAGQATPAGGKVSLATRCEGEGVVVAVRDTGVGMPPEVRSHLFQPFFTTKAPGAGTGLGLAVVHSIVTLHGGRIEVESQPGQGTCFTVHLPRVAPPPEKVPTPLPSPGGAFERPPPSALT